MTTIALLTDFPDRLSPMVVKELRQGLRTRLFGGVMLVLHALLVLITLMAGASTDSSDITGLMDGLVIFVLCGIFPLCGFSALAGEIKANTMDMLVLTRLSAWRIVMGKWAAIAFQSLLVTISVVPYIVARYVFGGSELFTDLIMLGFQWLISLVMTAGVVALSTQKQFWLRALIVLAPLFLGGVSSMVRLTMGVMGGSGITTSSTNPNGWAYVGWVVGAAWLIFALLSYGASRIAPAASLLSVTKRLVNLAAILLLPSLEWLVSQGHDISLLVIVVLSVASVDALTEQIRNLPSIYLAFYQRSWWGRLASHFLAPGWMHGFLYSLLLTAIGCIAVWGVQGWDDAGRVWLTICCLWLSALLAQILTWRRRGDLLAAMFGGAALLYVLTLFSSLIVVASRQKENLEWLTCILPSTTFWASQTTLIGGLSLFQTGLIVNAIWPGLLALFALRAFRQTHTAREEARQMMQA